MTESQIALIKKLVHSRQTVVRVVIAQVKGSTPRNMGSSMLIWRNLEGKLETFDTIGGGFLEEKAIEIAQLSLLKLQEKIIVQPFILGANLDQCCGGVVQLIWERFEFLNDIEWLLSIENYPGDVRRKLDLDQRKSTIAFDKTIPDGLYELATGKIFYETFTPKSPELWLFGAGHVARQLLKFLPDLNFKVRCFETRENVLGKNADDYRAQYPNVQFEFSIDINQINFSQNDSSFYLVMTHSHQIDFEICRKILQIPSFSFLGLIGSQTKSIRFKRRLQDLGLDSSIVNQLSCPIGKSNHSLKTPTHVAIEILSHLMQRQLAVSQLTRNTDEKTLLKVN